MKKILSLLTLALLCGDAFGQYSPPLGGGGGNITGNVIFTGTPRFSLFTPTRVPFFGTGGALSEDAGLTFSGSRLTATDLTVTNAPLFSAMTSGSVLFAGTSGVLSQDTSGLIYDPTTKRLGVGVSDLTSAGSVNMKSIAGQNPAFRLEDADLTNISFASLGFVPTVTTSTIGAATQGSSTAGGLVLAGFTNSSGSLAMFIPCYSGVSGANSTAPCFFRSAKTNGSGGATSMGSTDVAYTFQSGTSGTLLNILGSGNVGLSVTAPSFNLSFLGTAAKTIGLERNTTANTAGQSLTISSGQATSGSTDKAGGSIVLKAERGTGSAVSGTLQFQSDAFGTATGTTDHTSITRHSFGNTKSLTDATDAALANFTLATETVIAGLADYAVEVFDGTDVQVEEGRVTFHATNKASTPANNTVEKDAANFQQAVTAGTLACTFTITAANPAVLTLNCDTSLTIAGSDYIRVTYDIKNLTQQAVSIP